jgi:hypothetical protein
MRVEGVTRGWGGVGLGGLVASGCFGWRYSVRFFLYAVI